MRIVFGFNSFRTKTVHPQKVGIKETGFWLEARQKYFHICAIPLIPIDKYWVLRKNGRMYTMPSEYYSALYEHGIDAPNVWYAFLGPVVILLLFLIPIRHNGFRQLSPEEANKWRVEQQQKREARVDSLNDKDIVTIQDINTQQTVYLKAEGAGGENILFKKFITGSYGEEKPGSIELYYKKHIRHLDTLTLTKKLLKSALTVRYPVPDDLRKTAKNLLGDSGLYTVTKIERYFGPILSDEVGVGSSIRRGFIHLSFINSGWPVTVAGIKNIEGVVKWSVDDTSTRRPNHFPGQYSLMLNGENFKDGVHYKFLLLLKDTLQGMHTIAIEGTDFDKTITRLD